MQAVFFLRPSLVSRLVSGLLLILTLLQWTRLLWPVTTSVVAEASGLFMLIFLPLAFYRARPVSRVLFVLLTAAVIGLARTGEQWGPLWQALPEAALFAAFLAILQLMRFGAEQSRALHRTRRNLAKLSPDKRLASCAVGAYALGSFLNIGAHALMASSLPENTQDEERRQIAMVSLLGVACVSCWSPFFLALAFITHQLPMAPVSRVIMLGFASGVAIMLMVFALKTHFGGMGQIIKSLFPLAVPMALTAWIMAMVAHWTAFSPIAVIVICLPVLVGGYFLVCWPRSMPRLMMQGWNRSASLGNEILLITGAVILSAYMKGLGLPEWVQGLDALPIAVLLVAIVWLMIAAGLAGIHPTISSTVIITMMLSLHSAVAPVVLAVTVLIGWGLASPVSPVGLTAMLAGQAYRVPYLRLVFSRNLAYVVFIGLVCAVCMSFINGLFVGG